MSSLIVEICTVDEIRPHPNADRLEIAIVKGWQTAIKKGEMAIGQKVIYIPPDAVLPPELANKPEDGGRLGVANYCAPVRDEQGTLVGFRVRACRLRGEQSFGFIVALDPNVDPDWKVGANVQKHFGITKWEPPICEDPDAAPNNAFFHTYTDIEHFANYPDVLMEGEEVVMTEKIHGKNCRFGYILVPDKKGNASWQLMAGSHDNNRTHFYKKKIKRTFWQTVKYLYRCIRDFQRPQWYTTHTSDFWAVFENGIVSILVGLAQTEYPEPIRSVVVFGEMYGSGVQDMAYGYTDGKKAVRIFDIAINRRYLDYDRKAKLCEAAKVQMVPVLYRGPFSKEKLAEMTSGLTTVCDPKAAGKFSGREGTVVTPVVERIDQRLLSTGNVGRVIFKSVSADYLDRKDATDSK